MADAKNNAVVSFSATITLEEVEIRALEGITAYGVDSFLKVFKSQLGETHIRNHEQGIRSLFKAIGRDVTPALRDIDQARSDLKDAAIKRIKEVAENKLKERLATDGGANA